MKAVRRDFLYQNDYLLNSNSVSIFSVAPELDSQNTHACGGLRTPKRILSDAVPLLRDYVVGAFEMIVDWFTTAKREVARRGTAGFIVEVRPGSVVRPDCSVLTMISSVAITLLYDGHPW